MGENFLGEFFLGEIFLGEKSWVKIFRLNLGEIFWEIRIFYLSQSLILKRRYQVIHVYIYHGNVVLRSVFLDLLSIFCWKFRESSSPSKFECLTSNVSHYSCETYTVSIHNNQHIEFHDDQCTHMHVNDKNLHPY